MAFFKKNEKILFLFMIFFLSFFYGLGEIPLFNLDEGAFSEATREMSINGDFITTYLGGELRFDKPILIYWLQLICIKLFGLKEFAFRFPSALSSFLWGVAIYKFVKENFDEEAAFWSAFLFASSLQITIIGKAAIADALLNLLITLTMFFMWKYFKSNKRIDLYLVFLFSALGVLTKGPVAVLIPFAVSFIYLLYKKKFVFWIKSVFDLKGLALFFLIAAPWYIAEYLKEGEAFINGFILKHNLERFHTSFEGHKGSFFYYVPVIFIGLLPFSAVVFNYLVNIKKYFNDLIVFLLIWFLFVFVFFSFSGTKLPHYVIYGYTPLFIFGGVMVKDFKYKSLVILPISSIFLLLAFLPWIANKFSDMIKDEYVRILIENSFKYFDTFYSIKLLIISLIIIGFYFFEDIKKVFLGIGFLTVFAINGIVFPAYASLVEQPVKEAGIFIKNNNLKNVVMYGINTPSIMVYSQRIIKRKYPKKGEVVFTKINKLQELQKYKLLWAKNGVAVIEKI